VLGGQPLDRFDHCDICRVPDGHEDVVDAGVKGRARPRCVFGIGRVVRVDRSQFLVERDDACVEVTRAESDAEIGTRSPRVMGSSSTRPLPSSTMKLVAAGRPALFCAASSARLKILHREPVGLFDVGRWSEAVGSWSTWVVLLGAVFEDVACGVGVADGGSQHWRVWDLLRRVECVLPAVGPARSPASWVSSAGSSGGCQ
jgi:hypothetical protein